jgi:hypothetical protein
VMPRLRGEFTGGSPRGKMSGSRKLSARNSPRV